MVPRCWVGSDSVRFSRHTTDRRLLRCHTDSLGIRSSCAPEGCRSRLYTLSRFHCTRWVYSDTGLFPVHTLPLRSQSQQRYIHSWNSRRECPETGSSTEVYTAHRPGPGRYDDTRTLQLEAAPQIGQSRRDDKCPRGSWGSRKPREHSCHTSVPPHWADTRTVPSRGHSWCSGSPRGSTGRVSSWGNRSNQVHTAHRWVRCSWDDSGSDRTRYRRCPERCGGHSCRLGSLDKSEIQICTVHSEGLETLVCTDSDRTHHKLREERRCCCSHTVGRAGS